MMYREYKEKLERRKRIFDRLWFFRYLILAIFLLLLATTGALLGIGGMVYDVEVIPGLAEGELPAFVYGQTPSPTAKSIYGEAHFEYRALPDGEWTGEAPYLAGKYECRAVGTSVANTDRPGKSIPFEIAPLALDINVVGASLVYGDIPAFQANLLYGDTLQVENWVSDPENGRLNISADLSSVTVLDKEGRDVTFCYDFEAEIKNVEDKNRPAVVGLESETLTYDGAAHSLSCYAKGLAEGDTLKAEAPAFTDAGKYTENFLSYSIVDAEGKDVTAHYKITEQIGTLTINARPMSVTTHSNSWVYDGAPHSEEGFDAEALGEDRGLLEGHTAKAADVPTITNVSESGKENAFAVQIFEGTEDVTQNYQIESSTYGTLSVTKREIAVTTKTETFTYDGATHEYPVTEDYLTEGTLPEGHELTQTGTLTVKNAGTYPNRPTVSVYEGNVNRTQNYEITYDYGEVTVEQRKVSVTTASDTFTYDGLAHEYDEETLTVGETKLADGEAFVLGGAYSFTDADTYTNAPTVKVYAGGEETTSNYALTVTNGKITIKTRPMSVTTHSNSWVYDAIEHNEEGFDTQEEDAEGGLLSSAGHTAEGATRKFIEKVAESGKNEFEIKVLDGVGADVTHNYSIAYQYGTLTIDARPMSVTTHENSWVYDGAPHSENGFDAQEVEGKEVSGLISFHHAVAGEAPSVTNVAESGTENKFEIQIFDETNADVTQNYQIVSYTYGTLSVTKRPITVRTQPKAWVYDAKQHSYYGFTVDEGVDCGLAPMQTAQVDINETKIKTVSENGENGKDNVFTVKILDAEQNAVTENYEFTYVYGKLSIEERPISVSTLAGTWVYDADPHGNDNFVTNKEGEMFGTESGLLKVHTARISGDAPQITDVCQTGTKNIFEIEIYEGEEDVTENYRISYYYGTLTIKVRPMSVTTATNSWVYDADWHNEEGFTAQEEGTDCGLLASKGHTAEVLTKKYIQTVAESGENEFKIYVRDGEGAEVSPNYDITYTYGSITIEKRPIQVTTATHKWVYDAQEHWDSGFTTYEVEGKEESGLLASKGHTATAIDPPTIKTIAQADMPNNFKVSISDGWGADVTENYEISYTYGQLSLSARPVTITTNSQEWVYDGEAHVNSGVLPEEQWEENGLIASHTVKASGTTPSVTNVWDTAEKNNKFTVLIFEGDEDVSENYSITYAYGTLTITARPIQLKTATKAWIYDAEAHSDGSVTVVTENTLYSLVAGHKLERTIEKSVELPSLIDVGTKGNRFTFTWKVLAGEEDMTRNYVLLSENGILYGTLKVDPRPLQLQTATKSWVYDDTAHDAAEFKVVEVANTYYPLVKGHTYQWHETGRTSLKEVSSATNELTGSISIWADGRDVTTNYEVTVTYGTLTVLKRPVKVTTHSGTWNYDAMSHSEGGFEIEEEGKDCGLLQSKNHTATAVGVPSITNVKDSRENIFTVSITNGTGDVTHNYEIAYTYQRIEIKPIPLTITTNSGEWVYDAEAHKVEGIKAEGLINEQTIQLLITAEYLSITDVGEVTNEIRYWIWPKSSTTTATEPVPMDNYDITHNWGTLKVTKRYVTVTTQSGEWTYDGMPHSNPVVRFEAEKGDRGLLVAKGHFILVSDPLTITNVWESCENKFEVEINDGSSNDVTKNYEVEYDYAGVLVIGQRKVTVTTNSHTWVYSEGEQYYDDGFEVEWQDGDRGILYGYNVEAMFPSILTQITDSATRIRKVENKFYVMVTDGETDYSNNYLFEYTYGTLRVKAPVVVRLYLYKVEYDGTPHTYKNENGKTRYKVMSVPVDVKKEQVIFHEGYSALTQVTPISLSAEDLRGAFSLDVGQDEINRIDFTGSATPFVVSPRTIAVTSQSISMVQTATVTQIDGSHMQPGSSEKQPYSITRGTLLKGHTLYCEVTGMLYSGGWATPNAFNTAATRITDANGYDVTAYYNIIYKEGTLRWLTS